MLNCENEVKITKVTKDIRRLIYSCVDKFFKDKKIYYGGPIPNRFLHNEENVKLIADLDISEAVDKAYTIIGDKYSGRNTEIEGEILEVISILNECSARRIPKCFAGGILLICLRVCKGFGD